MNETTVPIDGITSIFDDAGVETRAAPDDLKTFIADCRYRGRGEVLSNIPAASAIRSIEEKAS